eukprot:m.15479 g.15479  ORF g.15479 m.15479 type:complete len:1736 (+) comp26395_c0_seq1:192-5399(+)
MFQTPQRRGRGARSRPLVTRRLSRGSGTAKPARNLIGRPRRAFGTGSPSMVKNKENPSQPPEKSPENPQTDSPVATNENTALRRGRIRRGGTALRRSGRGFVGERGSARGRLYSGAFERKRRPSFGRTGTPDVQENCTLHVKGVPPELDGIILARHFRQFGKVVKLSRNDFKHFATVTFSDHDSAAKAKSFGKQIQSESGQPALGVQLFWHSGGGGGGTDDSVARKEATTDGEDSESSLSKGMESSEPSVSFQHFRRIDDNTALSPFKREKDSPEISQQLSLAKRSFGDVFHQQQEASPRPFPPETETETNNPFAKQRNPSVSTSETISVSHHQPFGSFTPKQMEPSPTINSTPLTASTPAWIPLQTAASSVEPARSSATGFPVPFRLGTSAVKSEHDEMDSRKMTPFSSVPVSDWTPPHTVSVAVAEPARSSASVFPAAFLKCDSSGVERESREMDSRRKTGSVIPLRSSSLPLSTAYSAAERYEELKKRDAKMRQAVVKDTSIQTAKAVVGACPDMCPEKERYERESQRKYSYFEISVNSAGERRFDHMKAVKEYSRSSADKEEPLPHEIRSPRVLRMTMDYLMMNIMDSAGDRLPDWFDFVWNRTRAIRKDLTQQHICSVEAVDLTEKATRFHIFAGHFLCEEDIQSFDPNINNENLTKCLQSLKQYYTDLHNLKNITCSREAEFRAYSILLQLDQGDVLREVLTLSPVVRQSPEVKFALAVHSSFNSNNYVRFFRLIQRGTYLNACLLHRYFQQMRASGLKTMERGHLTPKRDTTFPLNEIVDLFAFEDEEDAANFCIHYGLDAKDGSVYFARNRWQQPTDAFPVRRAWKLIESKRNHSIGEIVHGGPLPVLTPHTLQSSFDASGQKQVAVTHTAEVHETEREPAEQIPITREVFLDVVKDIFVQTVDEIATSVAQECQNEIAVLQSVANALEATVERDTISGMLRGIAHECIIEATVQRSKIRLIGEALCAQAEEILNQTVALFSRQIAEEVYREALNSHLDVMTVDMACAESMNTIVDTCTHSMAVDISHETWRDEQRLRKEVLSLLSKQSTDKKLSRWFHRWRKQLFHRRHQRRHLRKRLEEFPVGPSLVLPEVQVSRLQPCDRWSTSPGKKMKLLASSSDPLVVYQIHQQLESQCKEARQARNALWSPYDFVTVLRKRQMAETESSSPVYWKMCVSLPAALPSRMFDWIRSKFLGGRPFSQGAAPVETCCHISDGKHVKAVVMGLKENISELDRPIIMKRNLLSGTSAFLFVVCHESLSEETDLANEASRLQRILSLLRPLPPLSLLVLYVSDHLPASSAFLDKALSISALVSSGLISSWQHLNLNVGFELERDQNILRELNSASENLILTSPAPPQLVSESLHNFIDSGLFRLFCQPLLKLGLGFELKNVGSLVSVYNETLMHLADVAGGQHLAQYSWPPVEFPNDQSLPPSHWNAPERLRLVRESIASLQMSPPEWSMFAASSWEDQCKKCLEFIDGETDLRNVVSCSVRTRQLLSAEKRKRTPSLPWAHIFQIIVDSKLSCLNQLPIYSSMFGGHSLWEDGRADLIYYLPYSLQDSHFSRIWEGAAATGYVELTRSSRRSLNKDRRFNKANKAPMLKFRDYGCPTVHSASDDCVRGAHLTSSKLRRSLESARQQSANFESQLNRWLDSGSSVVALSSSAGKADLKAVNQPKAESQIRVGARTRYSSDVADELSHRIVELRRNIEGERRLDSVNDLHLKGAVDLL